MRGSVWLLASCAVLAGCSGGGTSSSGSGGSVIIAAPTPTPTVSPAPTPTPAIATGEVKPGADATFISASMELTTTGGTSQTNGIITGGMTSNRSTTFDTPGFAGTYNSSTGYRLSDTVNAQSFGQLQLSADTFVPNGNGVVLFTNASGSVVDYLALYQVTTFTSSVKGMGYTAARYGGNGGWQHTVGSGGTGQTRLDYFAYGSATPLSGMPHSGVVRYSILSAGNYATDTDLWFLPGSSGVTLTVDFGAGTVSGILGFGGQNFYKSEVGGIGSFRVNGTISGNAMSMPITDAAFTISGILTTGQLHLVFVGPNANELILTYVVGDARQTAVGSAVGVIDPNIN